MIQYEEGLIGYPKKPSKAELKALKMKKAQSIVDRGYTQKIACRMVGISREAFTRWKRKNSPTE
jgi:hypothetical protein